MAFTFRRVAAPFTMFLFILYFLAVTGCGSGGATVNGTVAHEGKPVTGGTLTFAPAAGGEGKPVTAVVQTDGTFEVEGAVAGRQQVRYSPPVIEWDAPEWDGKGTPPQAPKSPYDGLAPKEPEIDVAAGGADIKVELVAKKKP